MTENELRIGNYITKSLGTIYRVEGVVMNNVFTESMSFPVSEFSGIPLSEEWLIKFGFKKHGPPQCNATFWENKVTSVYWTDGEFCTSDDLPIKSVHQLQNYHFALTGEELTIKE